jgi:hypothetical protein
MVDEREAWLTDRFEVVRDLDVPDLWEQIVARADTDRNVDVVHGRRWRWVPLAAAAAVLALVVAGLVVWARDDSSNVDTPPGPGGGDNMVGIVHGDRAGAVVTPTAVAGTVSFDITNPTDDYRGLQIRPMRPGATIDDVRAAARPNVLMGGADPSGVLGDPVLGVDGGPKDHFVTAMPLSAGNYAVLLITEEATFAAVSAADGLEVRQLSVAAGEAGAAPAPTLRFDRLAMDGLIGPTTAPRGQATIRVDDASGGTFLLALIELRPDATRSAYEAWERDNGTGETQDWSTAPIATVRGFYAGAPHQTVTIDLEGGDLYVAAPSSTDQAGPSSVVMVAVE